MTETFRRLHGRGTFVIPNPWDRGSARILVELGYPALATTSSGFARSIGRNDQEVARDELVHHVAEMAGAVSVPIHVDGERLYPDDRGGITETVRLLSDVGAAGCSIEDFDPGSGIAAIDDATAAVAEAASACAEVGLVLTARAENHLHGVGDLDDTIRRLRAYAGAGAEVLYAPGLTDTRDISRVVSETGRPVNVLLLAHGPDIGELADLGVRRISTGGDLQRSAYSAMRERARQMSVELDRAVPRDDGATEHRSGTTDPPLA